MSEPAISISPIGESFALEVKGVDAARPLTTEVKRALLQAINRAGIIVVRGGLIDDDALAAFGECFGPLFSTRSMGGAGPERKVLRLSNMDTDGAVLPPDDRFRRMNPAHEKWHVDNSFSAPPGIFSIAQGRVLTSHGGQTEFANMRLAYAALPEDTKARIRNLTASHNYLHSRRAEKAEFSQAERDALPSQRRPLVLDVGGRNAPSLYLASHIEKIEGMADDEAQKLVADLTAFGTQDCFVYRHIWTVGDILVYDNRLVMHRATPFPEEPRELRALRVIGELTDPAFDLAA